MKLTAIDPRFDTVVTVRSDEKGQRILDAHPNTPKEKLSYVVVKDVAADGAFDDVSGPLPCRFPIYSIASA